MTLRVLDLFSGIGGFSLGLERAGMRTVAFCEIDDYNRWQLSRRWPGVPIYEDVRTLDGRTIEADVICGGFPCQDISHAGKRVGIEGERSGLWREYARIIGELRPRFALVENVSAINIRGLGFVLGDLAAIGYDAEWHVIPAEALGAPHERERCWIVAYPQGESRLYQPHIGAAAARLLADSPPWETCPWDSSPACVCGMDDGIPLRVVDTERFGNAVVPCIPEILGRAIISAEGKAHP